MLRGVGQKRQRPGGAFAAQRVAQGADARRYLRLPGEPPRAAGTAVRWAMAGFLLGAGFWIYLGVRALTLPPTVSGLRGGLAPGCTSLALDRISGRTTAGPCTGKAAVVPETLTARLTEHLLR